MGYLDPHLDPILEGSRGQNHIDGRLGHQCYYGVLDPFLGPHFGGIPRPLDLGSGTPDPGSGAGPVYLGDSVRSQGFTRIPGIRGMGIPWDA